MAKRIWGANDRVWKDNGDPAADGTIAVRLGGTATAQTAYTNIGLSAGAASSFNIASDGYLENNASLYVADDVTVDIVITATGFNGGQPLTVENVAVAASTTTDESSSDLALGNAIPNGGFDSWSGGTSFSNVSGDGDGDEVADGWYLTQPAAAANAVSREDGFAIGADPVEARFCAKVGRPQSSSVTNEIRLWKTLPPEVCYRLRGKSVTLRYSLVAGANFSASGLSVTLATGTTESEDGDLIDSGGFGGHQNAISQARAITTTAARYEDTVTLGATIKEIGIQFSYTPVGTAGANDWFKIQDVELKEEADSEEFSALPEALTYLLANLSTLGRNFVGFGASAPGADRIVFWDHSALDFAFLTAGTGLAISTTTISIDQAFAPTWTGAHAHEVAVDADLVNYSNTTTTNDMAVRFASSGTLWELTPKPSGSADATKGFGYDYSNARWFLDTPLAFPAGAVGTPSLNFGGNSGWYSDGANGWAFAANGSLAFSINSNGNMLWSSSRGIYVASGSVSAPRLAFNSDQDCGWYLIGTNNVGLSLGGAKVVDYTTAGPLDAAGAIWRVGGKNAVPIVAAAMKSPASNGAADGTFEPGNGMAIPVKDFDAGTQEYACFVVPMPKSWNEGTVTARFRYTGTGSGNVIWGIAGVAISDDDALNTALGTAQEVTDTMGTSGDQMVSPETSAVTIAGSPAEGDLVCFRVYRKAADGGDTLTNDARLIAVDLFVSFNAPNDV